VVVIWISFVGWCKEFSRLTHLCEAVLTIQKQNKERTKIIIIIVIIVIFGMFNTPTSFLAVTC